ncbi:MAG TPA: class I SAM-dependent methyltransferase [Methylibium sp.]|uniref:class I SAM-dependent methyltransferase n=1 Tax=Methylibium sp. TaxID=2067992 RepID=UPI002DB72104|nr:class I SAM-dependent methyltransferase [Methylibium sp.]HEU4457795.1 class I SAM-dependent methyltransferase [Methylibium sp.]
MHSSSFFHAAAAAQPRTRPAIQARFWDRVACRYAAAPIADVAGYEATLRRVQQLLSVDDAVLEIGCGTGSTALRLAAGTRSMLATDVSSGMIAIARRKLAAQALPQLRFEVAEAGSVSASADGPFDAVLGFNVLHLMTDLDDTLRSVLASLRPGGLFISKTACLAEMNPLVPRVLVPLMKALGKAPEVLVLDAGMLRAAFERHGLVIDAIERHGTRRKDFRVFIVARKQS